MAGFTGSLVTQPLESGYLTHLVRVHDPVALCGAPVSVKGFSLRITSNETGSILHTLLEHEAYPCAACLTATRLLD